MQLVFNVFSTLIVFVVSFLFSAYIVRFYKSEIANHQSNRFGAIDGLRGYLALSVFIEHYVTTYYWKTQGEWRRPPEQYFENFGTVGVAIFFMITGFLFVSKVMQNKEVDWVKLFKSRVFRIYPLYLFCVLIVVIVSFYDSRFSLRVSGYELFIQFMAWILYYGEEINGYKDTVLIIASVAWTLKYEWLFYISLPAIRFVIKKGWPLILIASIGIVILFFKKLTLYHVSSDYFILFLIGGCVAWLRVSYQDRLTIINTPLISIFALIAYVAALWLDDTYRLAHIALMSLFFLCVALGNTLFGLFSNKVSIFLGEISFSIYLVHGIILYFLFSMFFSDIVKYLSLSEFLLFMPLTSLFVILCSWMTFTCIEAPVMKFGKK
ncbi:acyltransferase family protein [Methylotuvimicrobium sp.]|uniref:acyltransferase family protein n=1 Tax=Methylotuvimicrobium sp. TaxID=2822413 RepID=UPI003D64744F